MGAFDRELLVRWIFRSWRFAVLVLGIAFEMAKLFGHLANPNQVNQIQNFHKYGICASPTATLLQRGKRCGVGCCSSQLSKSGHPKLVMSSTYVPRWAPTSWRAENT